MGLNVLFKVDIVQFEIGAVTLPPVARPSVPFTLRSPCGEVFRGIQFSGEFVQVLRTTQLNILQNADLNALAKYITSRTTLFNPASSSSSGVFTLIKDLGALKDPEVLRSFGTPRVFVIPDYPAYLPDNPEDENATFALLGGPQRALQVHLHN
jgi:hypothetical protein